MATPIVYDATTNTHRPATDGEFLMLSQDADNYLRYGRDRGVYISGNDILSNGSENLLVIDGNDKRVTLTRSQLSSAGFMNGGAADLISSQAGNLIVLGNDQKLYVGKDALINAGFLTTATLSDLISNDTGNAIKRGSDGRLYSALDCGELD